jgi:hypothetical protein
LLAAAGSIQEERGKRAVACAASAKDPPGTTGAGEPHAVSNTAAAQTLDPQQVRSDIFTMTASFGNVEFFDR